jgi:DNA-binding MarR family transcriptional regulator
VENIEMEKILAEFIGTLDVSLKRVQRTAGPGFSQLTINQLHYIDAIHDLGEPTLTALAARLNFTKASVTTGINKLVGLGYVVKTPSSQDRRVVHLSLTPAGRDLIAARQQVLSEYGAFIRAALDEAEARQFEATLDKLVQFFRNRPIP